MTSRAGEAGWASSRPGGTPRPIVEKLNAAIRKAPKDPALRERAAPLGLEMPDDAMNTPDGFRAFIQSGIDRWVPVIREARLTLN